ncbi:MAG: peptidase domain protein [Caulobacter sp.]|nr:peptidase domain protein [Caulobacter sp.]
MIRVSRPALVLAAGLALSACAHVEGRPPSPTPASHQAPAALAGPTLDAVKPGQWPQAVSDIAPDPRVRFGVLPSGLRYAIQKNATPPGQAALRLWFDAGSLMETDAQQGLAHFLEHMAFNGSKNVPEGEMIKILERHGLAFGADTNASTSWDETVYKLDLPKTDADTIDTSLMLLREAAGDLTIAPEAVDRERGVVLSEERSRDTPSYRVVENGLAFLLEGQRPPERLPIGKPEILKTAPAQTIRDFYQAWYRPERAVIVAVGDFDVDAMEAKIKARFGDWKAQAPALPAPPIGAVRQRGLTARMLVEPGAPLSVQLAWVAPPDLLLETRAKDQRDLAQNLGFAVLNRRLQALSRAADPPFISAGGFRNDQFHAAEITTLVATAQPGRWREALTALEQEQRRLVQYGVRQDELDREIASIRSNFVAAAAGEATQRTTSLAGGLVNSLGDKEIVTSPSQDLIAFDAAVKGLTAAQVSIILKGAFAASGPLVLIPAPTALEGGEPAILATYAQSAQAPVAAPAAPTTTAWPYAVFGPIGQVVERREITDLDTVFVRFANGVRLTVKPTKFRDDQILVKARIGNGLLDLPKTSQSPLWSASAFVEGGLKQINAEDMERVLNGKVWNAGLGVEDDAFALSGRTRPEDLETELQVLAAYATEPGWGPDAFQRVKTYGGTMHDQLEATNGGVLGRDLAGLLHSGDPRWTFPTRPQIASASLDALKGAVTQPLATGAIEVVVVGDTTVDKAVAAVAATFGSLPPRPGLATAADARAAAFPKPSPAPVVRTHKGRADQGSVFIAWPTDDFFANPQQARTLNILAQVMQLRLTDELREKQGATYSPQAGAAQSFVFPNWGYLSVSVEVPPAQLEGVAASVRKIAAALRDQPVTADELERAKKPRLDQLEKARVTNEYWVGTLSGAQTDPRLLDAVRSVTASLERVSAADLQAAARQFLADDRSWTLLIKPEGK